MQESVEQWFPTFSDAFLPLLILEIFIPPQWKFHSLPVRQRGIQTRRLGGAFK